MVSRSQLGSRFRLEFLSTLTGTLSGALLVVVLARLLDPDAYGLLYLTLSVIGVGKLFAKLGLGRSTARYIAEYKESDPGQLSHIIRFSAVISFILMMITSIIIGVAHQQIANLIDEPGIAPFLIIGSLFLFFTTLLGFLRKVLQGFEAIKPAALLSIIQSIGKFGFAVGLTIASFGAIGALTGYALGSLIASIVGIFLVYFRYYRPLDHNVSVESGLRRRIAEYAVPVTASEAAGNLSGRVDTILVGFFLNPVAVSYYTVANQVVTMIQSPVNALGFTLAPTLGAEQSAGNTNRAARIYEKSFINIMLLYIPASVGLILIAEPLIQLVFGRDYLGAVSVLQVFALYAVVQANLLVSSKGLDFLGKARTRAIVNGVTSTLNLGLNIVLIPTIGVIGAAIATVVTGSMYAMCNIYIIHKELQLRERYMIKETIKIVMLTSAMGIVVFLLSGYISGWFTLLAVVGLGVLICVFLSTTLNIVDLNNIISDLM